MMKRQPKKTKQRQSKQMNRQSKQRNRQPKQKKRTKQNTSNCGCRYKIKRSNMKIIPKLMEVSINHPFHPKSKMPKIPPKNMCNMY